MTQPVWASLLERAEATYRGGNANLALELAQRAHDGAPDRPAPAFFLCRLLLERRDARANAVLARLEAFPQHGPGWEGLGHALAAQHPAAARVAFARAAKAYGAAETTKPTAKAALRLGLVLRALGDGVAARAALERAAARNPALAPAHFALGLLRQDGNDRAGAVAAFRAALSARPDHHEAAFNLAVALQEAGDIEAALDQYALAWRLRPDSFGRIAQALVSPGAGRLWLSPAALRSTLASRAGAEGPSVYARPAQ